MTRAIPHVHHLFRSAMGSEFIFMDDNATPHRTVSVTELLEREDIARMKWPAISPDFDLIEHVWDTLGRRLAACPQLPATIPQLQLALR